MIDWMQAVRVHASNQSGALGQARHGVVTSVDPVTHAVRVKVQPEGLETGWIPDGVLAAGRLRVVCPSEIGTQVLIIPVEGDAEHPVVVGRLFDAATRPPVSPFTGKNVEPGEIAIFGADGDCLHFRQTGLFIKGNVQIDGDVVASGDIRTAEVSLKNHVHGGVQSGQAYTRVPGSSGG